MYKKSISRLICTTILFLLLRPLSSSGQTNFLLNDAFKKRILENGLTMIYMKDESSAITMIYLIIQGGKRVEPEEKRGLSYMTTRLAVEIPDQRKIQNFMSQASRVTTGSQGDYSFIKIASLSESLEDTLKIIGKIILDPLFSGVRIDWIKEQFLHRGKIEEDEPLHVAHETILEALLADKGYGGPAYGDEETLKKIKKKDIINFYKNYFKGNNMILAVSSNLEEEQVFRLCSEHFATFPPGTPFPFKPAEVFEKTDKTISIEKDTKQSVVSLGFPLPKMSGRNFALGFVLETLLGKGVGSRLWPLRADENLAYNVNSRATQMLDGGILEAYLETDHEREETAMEALKRILGQVYEQGVSEEELEDTKIQCKATFLRLNETKETKTLNVGTFEALGLGYEFFGLFLKEIDDITLDEMNSYIKEILNLDNSIEVIIGPEDTNEK